MNSTNRMPRVVLAATRSGSGKTLITCAMLNAFKMAGKNVSGFKCGPDYIDPMFHKKVLGVPSKNLDLFFTEEKMTRELFLRDNHSEISVIEGVMGLFDGVAGITEEASTYHLAKTLDSPVILIIDAHGMGRSVLAEIKGFLSMDESKLIKAVILNNVSETFYESIKSLIESQCGIMVAGYYPKLKGINLESRHLGLKMPDEIKDIKNMVDEASEVLKRTVNLDMIADIAEKAALNEWNYQAKDKVTENGVVAVRGERTGDGEAVRVAVAMDEAFSFYYDDNLSMLREKGAEIVPFSPIHDIKLPENIQGIILGGGYPELFAKELSENISMKKDILKKLEKGIPSLAECGGFMYLHDEIVDAEGIHHKMVGAIKAKCQYMGRLIRFGYVEIEEIKESFFYKENSKNNSSKIRGHEFHYFDSELNGESCVATKPVSGRCWNCGHTGDNHWWGFAHLYYPSNPEFVDVFIEKCMEQTKRKNS